MNNLLFDEPPLVVSPTLAALLGLNEAIVLQQFNYWLKRSNKQFEGYTWIYNTIDKWLQQFPFFSKSTLRRTITHLETQGIVVTGNFNQKGFDKTKWYRIDYDRLESVSTPCVQNEHTMSSNWTHGSGQNEQTNTRDYPETTTENNNAAASSAQTQAVQTPKDSKPAIGDVFDLFQSTWNFPNEPQRQRLVEIVNAYGSELTIVAMRLAGEKSVKRSGVLGFIDKVLSDWKTDGVQTAEQAREEAKQHNQKNYGGYGRQQQRPAEELHDWNKEEYVNSSDDSYAIKALQKQLAAKKQQKREEES